MTNLRLFKSYKLIYIGLLLVVAICLTGCLNGTSQTSSEISRTHGRVLRSSMQQMQDDIDAMLLLDRPSRLSEKFTR